uniref:Uncharacterized protein n=1 Tax=Clytia hemisphaerica TaxID=252671 RepID=A0A7M5UT88_9CNID
GGTTSTTISVTQPPTISVTQPPTISVTQPPTISVTQPPTISVTQPTTISVTQPPEPEQILTKEPAGVEIGQPFVENILVEREKSTTTTTQQPDVETQSFCDDKGCYRLAKGLQGEIEVCYGFSRKQPARFLFPKKGQVVGYRLVHSNGLMTCQPQGTTQSTKWGCEGRIETIITDNTYRKLHSNWECRWFGSEIHLGKVLEWFRASKNEI